MKKYALIFILAFLFVFSSCEKAKESALTTLPDISENTETYEYVADIGEHEEVGVTTEPQTVKSEPTEKNKSENQTKNEKKTERRTESASKAKTENKTENKAEKKTESITEKKSDRVTISVNCSEILNNMDKLKKGKEYFVPSDGIILGETAIEISDGDTAFDVLKKVCKNNEIQLEYAYSGGFGTYYIEGINQLYEKDCGITSGWLYSVNGEYPSVGASSYKLKNGDNIMFVYSCDNF